MLRPELYEPMFYDAKLRGAVICCAVLYYVVLCWLDLELVPMLMGLLPSILMLMQMLVRLSILLRKLSCTGLCRKQALLRPATLYNFLLRQATLLCYTCPRHTNVNAHANSNADGSASA